MEMRKCDVCGEEYSATYRSCPFCEEQAAIRRGVILITAENNVIRFLPPLVIGKEHVDEMISVLKAAIEENME